MTRLIDPADWRGTLGRLRAEGYRFLDLVTAVDRIDQVEVVAHVLDPTTGERRLLSTCVPSDAPRLESIVGEFAAAAWHERETAEMFGVEFVGHPDPRPLLLREAGSPPLRKSTPLPERLATAWPGTTEDGRRARRPQLPPGVRPEWLTGERA